MVRVSALSVLLASSLFAALALTSVSAADESPTAEIAARCSFKVGGLTYKVAREGKVTCKTGKKIGRSFITDGDEWESHGGPAAYQTHYTHPDFPGWRCGTGAGGGGCRKGSRRVIFATGPS